MKKILEISKDNMIVFIGLGNPEMKFSDTKHNVGYWALDMYAKKNDLVFKPGKANYLVSVGQKVMLIKPTSGMNVSGQPSKEAIQYYKCNIDQVVIIYDDVDLPLGEIRLREKGGDGCHRGMRSIIESFSSDQIKRVRIGVAADDYKRPSENFVLRPFQKQYAEKVNAVLDCAVSVMEGIFTQGFSATMNNYNKQIIGEA
jgi:PTH1 family peptidyl-tRNA hydrolase